jgi:hypothetical protein
MYPNLSRQNRLMLEKYTHSNCEKVRQVAVDALTGFSGGFVTSETEGGDAADDVWDVADDEAWDGIDDGVPF